MKGDITNKKQVLIMANLENIGTLAEIIADMVEDGLENRDLVGYHAQKMASLLDMIGQFARESLVCAEALEVQEEA